MKRPLSGKAKRVKSIRKFSKEIKQHMQISKLVHKTNANFKSINLILVKTCVCLV